MQFFAMLFAVLMIAAAFAATILVGMYAGGFWGGLAFAALLILLYRGFSDRNNSGRLQRNQLNAFQAPLDEE